MRGCAVLVTRGTVLGLLHTVMVLVMGGRFGQSGVERSAVECGGWWWRGGGWEDEAEKARRVCGRRRPVKRRSSRFSGGRAVWVRLSR